MVGGHVNIRKNPEDDLWRVSAPRPDGMWIVFRIDRHGNVIQHGLPLWAWFLITGVYSSVFSIVTVWAIWG